MTPHTVHYGGAPELTRTGTHLHPELRNLVSAIPDRSNGVMLTALTPKSFTETTFTVFVVAITLPDRHPHMKR